MAKAPGTVPSSGVTLTHVLSAAAILVTLCLGIGGAVWTVINSVTTGLRDDIKAIRDDVSSVRSDAKSVRDDVTSVRTALQGSDKNNAMDIMRSERGLGQQIDQLRTDMASFTASVTSVSVKFDAMNKAIDGLSGQIGDMKKELATRPVAAAFDPDKIEAVLKERGLSDKVILVVPGLAPAPK